MKKFMEIMDTIAAVLTTYCAIIYFLDTGDWRWICFWLIAISLETRCWVLQKCAEKSKKETDFFRGLYNGKCSEVIALIKQIEDIEGEGK